MAVSNFFECIKHEIPMWASERESWREIIQECSEQTLNKIDFSRGREPERKQEIAVRRMKIEWWLRRFQVWFVTLIIWMSTHGNHLACKQRHSRSTTFSAKFHKSYAIRTCTLYIVHTSTHACVANVPIFIALNLCSFSHCCCIVIAIHSYAQYQLTEFYSIVFSPSSIHSFVLFCRLFISDCFLIRAFRTKWRNKSTKVHEEHTHTHAQQKRKPIDFQRHSIQCNLPQWIR